MERKNISRTSPTSKISGLTTRFLNLLFRALSTRLELVTVEIQQEKQRILSLILMTGLALVFATFALMSILLYVLMFLDSSNQPGALLLFTGILIALAILFVILIRINVRRATILAGTRDQIKNDLTTLAGERDE